MFMNNRIGTFLRKDGELQNIRDIVGNFKPGDMAVEVIEESLYKWCIVSEIYPDGTVKIITRDSPKSCDFYPKIVRVETLKQYSSTETIEQNTTMGINLSADQLLETYITSYFDQDQNPYYNNC